MRLWKSRTSRNNLITLAAVVVLFGVMMILNAAGLLSRSLRGQLVPICVYVIMAVSLNLTVGVLGELSLGHAGFMGVGAISGVIAASFFQPYVHNPVLLMIIAMVIGALLAAGAGALIGIPALRLRGDYLAIVTLAFGEILRNIFTCLYVRLQDGHLSFYLIGTPDAVDSTYIIAGPQGAFSPDRLSTFGIGFVAVVLTLMIIMNVTHSREGRAIKAIRDNHIAAESVGLNITAYKMKAFVLSAALAGMAGVLFAMNYSNVEAKKFDFNTSISVLVMVVLGGMGNIRGSIIAAIVLTILPEMLRSLENYRMLIYAVILILVMVLKPGERLKQLRARKKEAKS